MIKKLTSKSKNIFFEFQKKNLTEAVGDAVVGADVGAVVGLLVGAEDGGFVGGTVGACVGAAVGDDTLPQISNWVLS